MAATDGQKVVLVNGRKVKATVQYRNKQLARLHQQQAPMTKGSRRWKRLQRRKHALLDKTQRQVRDACHQATHIVTTEFPGATCYVGEPYNDAAQKMGRVQAQQVSQACTRKIITQLDDKTSGAIRHSCQTMTKESKLRMASNESARGPGYVTNSHVSRLRGG